MMDCKQALTEAKGDMEQAVVVLDVYKRQTEDISMEEVLGAGTRKQPVAAKESVDEAVPQVETQTY